MTTKPMFPPGLASHLGFLPLVLIVTVPHAAECLCGQKAAQQLVARQPVLLCERLASFSQELSASSRRAEAQTSPPHPNFNKSTL